MWRAIVVSCENIAGLGPKLHASSLFPLLRPPSIHGLQTWLGLFVYRIFR